MGVEGRGGGVVKMGLGLGWRRSEGRDGKGRQGKGWKKLGTDWNL